MMSLGSEEGFYHKRHLVPFGDYVPFEWLRGVIAFFDLPMSAFVPGPQKQPLLAAAGQKVGVSICYEDVFSTEVLQTVPEATLLVNATNNAWYGDSFAPHQHLQISRSRALETGRPLVRATTNGISAFVNFKGEIQAQTPQFEQAALTQTVQPRQGETPYVTLKRWPIWLLSLLMLCLWAYYRHKKSD
jgi:apolipoprotein N-acyltransferase